MTLLDWVLLVVWLGLTLGGFWEGAVRLAVGGGGVIAGVWLAIAVGGEAAMALEQVVRVHWLAAALGRVLPLLGCALVALAAGWGIERTLDALRLKWLNRLCGAVLAGGVGLLLLGLLLSTAVRLSPTWRGWCAESLLGPPLVRLWGLALEAGDDVVVGRGRDDRLRVTGYGLRIGDSATRPDRDGLSIELALREARNPVALGLSSPLRIHCNSRQRIAPANRTYLS